jgi:hypothetical protein
MGMIENARNERLEMAMRHKKRARDFGNDLKDEK